MIQRIPYQFPIVIFHGEADDTETTEIIQQDAEIQFHLSDKEPYEADICAEGYHFHMIFGQTRKNTYYLCIPNRASGFEFNSMHNVGDNIETMYWYCNNLDYEDICAIAFGLKSINDYLNDHALERVMPEGGKMT